MSENPLMAQDKAQKLTIIYITWLHYLFNFISAIYPSPNI